MKIALTRYSRSALYGTQNSEIRRRDRLEKLILSYRFSESHNLLSGGGAFAGAEFLPTLAIESDLDLKGQASNRRVNPTSFQHFLVIP
jgi:hypothetical protein